MTYTRDRLDVDAQAARRAVAALWRNRSKHLNLRARVHGAGYLSPADLREIVRRDESSCVYCGQPLDYEKGEPNGKGAASFDHVVRLADGGSHSFENVVCACRECNQKNAQKSLTDPMGEAIERLRRYLARKGSTAPRQAA